MQCDVLKKYHIAGGAHLLQVLLASAAAATLDPLQAYAALTQREQRNTPAACSQHRQCIAAVTAEREKQTRVVLLVECGKKAGVLLTAV